jgi:putative endonuclease
MNFTVYILYSLSINHYYVGQTENFDVRYRLHLDKELTGNFTKRASDWKVFYRIECSTRKQAVNIEAHIKRMKSIKYILNLKKYPEIEKKLKDKYL